MTEKQDSVVDPFEENEVDVQEPDEETEEAFLRDVLGPAHADEAKKLKAKNPWSYDRPERMGQEDYDPAPAEPEREYETEGGKKLRVRQLFNGHYEIYFYPGGELPKELKGEYTNEELAHQKIRLYLAKRNAKNETEGNSETA